MIDVVSVFEDSADHYNYGFAYGREDVQNYHLSEDIDLAGGQYVILMDAIEETAQISNSLINRWSCLTTIALGKKFDVDNQSGTASDLDETEKQKYDRRLKEMRGLLEAYLKYVFCNYDLELQSAFMIREINKYDENIDIIAARITFLYDSGDETVEL